MPLYRRQRATSPIAGGRRHRWIIFGPPGVVEMSIIRYEGEGVTEVAETAESAISDGTDIAWMPMDVGVHSRGPLYPGHSPMRYCEVLTGGPCYFDGDPSLIRRDILQAWINADHDDEILWDVCVKAYRDRFGEDPSK